MALSTPAYLLFAGAVWLVVRILRRADFRKAALISASLLFYALLDLRYLFVLILLGALTYALGIAIGRGRRVNLCAIAGIVAALAALAFYKYSAAWQPAPHSILPEEIGGWVLPVGISFYAFQSISYLVHGLLSEDRRRSDRPPRGFLPPAGRRPAAGGPGGSS
jgi:D-alanyl-lipoteichoic acid acyltransferase DltB (MBOAT superfamily)